MYHFQVVIKAALWVQKRIWRPRRAQAWSLASLAKLASQNTLVRPTVPSYNND